MIGAPYPPIIAVQNVAHRDAPDRLGRFLIRPISVFVGHAIA